MSDLVTRLRNWREVHLARLHLLMDQAADEMAVLQSDNNRRADLEAGLREGVEQLQAEIERLRQVLSQKNHYPDADNAATQDILTDAEREAVTTAMHAYGEDNADPECAKIEATLWGLLERL